MKNNIKLIGIALVNMFQNQTTPVGGIGYEGKLIARFKEDGAHFKRTTMGHICVMGRNTYEEIAARGGLDGRWIITLSSFGDELNNVDLESNVICVKSSKIAIEVAKRLIKRHNLPNSVFICGGQQVYEDFIHQMDSVVLTTFVKDVPADRFFPISYITHRGSIVSEVDLPHPTAGKSRCKVITWKRK